MDTGPDGEQDQEEHYADGDQEPNRGPLRRIHTGMPTSLP